MLNLSSSVDLHFRLIEQSGCGRSRAVYQLFLVLQSHILVKPLSLDALKL